MPSATTCSRTEIAVAQDPVAGGRTVDDWSQGAPLAWIQDICRYWAESYDWRSREARLNRFAQFMTEIDGLDIHFIHVALAASGSDAADDHPRLARLGRRVPQGHRAADRSDPHGGNAADAFHVVCPSLPGFGFSGKPTTTGWGVERIARPGRR